LIGEELKAAAMELCREISNEFEGSSIVGACFYGSRVSGHPRKDSDLDLLIILDPFPKGVLYRYKVVGDVTVSALIVDKGLFEGDVEKAQLGEFVAGRLLTPYIPFLGADYLRHQEVKAKERFVIESLESLVTSYPKISRELRIKPEFFVFDKMERRSRIYPPVAYSYQKMLVEDLRKANLASIMEGFFQALKRLEGEGLIGFDGEFIVINPSFLRDFGRRRLGALQVLKDIRKAAMGYVIHGFAGRSVSPITVAQEFASKIKREIAKEEELGKLDDPLNYLYLPSKAGLVRLSERAYIEALPKHVEYLKDFEILGVRKLGSAVNFVYLLTMRRGEENRLIAVKLFKDWHGLKWFPLALWTLGVQKFSLRGSSRLANEYTALLQMRKKGLPAPEVLHVSWANRTLFTEYIEGSNAQEFMKGFLAQEKGEEGEGDGAADTLIRIGATLARVHENGIVLGDPKPENIIIDESGKVYFLDLEQAVLEGGDPAWDLAELLYYSGHYTFSMERVSALTKSLVQGYLTRGSKDVIKKALKPKYVRVFAVITPPHILRAIIKECKELAS
jgi:tRNA A-37 threonylcarbamoyl transferase component Bud32/predicted nucleotidyltransferase